MAKIIDEVLGLCASCRQIKNLRRLGGSYVYVCEDCEKEVSLSEAVTATKFGKCKNCRQTGELKRLGKSSIYLCSNCIQEAEKGWGKKILIVTEPYTSLDVEVDRDYLISELTNIHYKIHEDWFFMKTPQVELYHYLVIAELIRLGEDALQLCYGELKDLYAKRKKMMEENYAGGI